MRKIVVSISKGGVGKSTSAVSIAHGLSLQGKKTLLIDTDDQGQCSWMLGVQPDLTLAEVLNEETCARNAIFSARENLWILSGGKPLSGVKRAIGRKDFGGEKTLSESLKILEGMFDFVIVDTSPAFDTLTINALFYCSEVLTPVSLEALTLNSLAEFSNRIKDVSRHNTSLAHKYVVPTFKDGRVKKSSEILGILEKHYGNMLCPPIHYSARLSESAGFGKTIFEYDKRSSGAKDYEKVIERILQQ